MEVRIETKDLILRKVEIKDKNAIHKIRNEDHILNILIFLLLWLLLK